MWGAADFEPDDASSYFLARESVAPPSSLRQMVWPDLDRWRRAHLVSRVEGEGGAVEPNMVAGAFLELLDKLRDVFLQVTMRLYHLNLLLINFMRILFSIEKPIRIIPFSHNLYLRRQITSHSHIACIKS